MTASPANINVKVYMHATLDETVTLTDSVGAPLNLTGKTALCHVRKDRSDADIQITLSSADGGIILGGALGTVTFVMDNVETGALDCPYDAEAWAYDLLITDPTFNPDRVDRTFQGLFFIIPGATRPA
jgi:hypothetical protein